MVLLVHIPTGRRGAVLAAASAAVVCLGVLATFGPGDGTDPGYVAVGSAGPSPGATANVPPGGGVDLVPLDGSTASSTHRAPGASAPGAGEHGGGGTAAPDGSTTGSGAGGGADGGGGSTSRTAPGGSGGTTARPSTAPPASSAPSTTATAPAASAAPARLTVSAPVRAASDVRWCEYVTVTFTNTGDKAATSGTVTFGTHIIGVLGIDWATIDTEKPVPVPVKGGAKKEKTWEICVDAWRVPLGMHIETQDVSLG
ncbi:hypothetical protein ACFXJ5_06725 [Streptomyces sp. NPDC059373]